MSSTATTSTSFNSCALICADDGVRADGDQRHARYGGVVGGCDRQRLDVVAAAGYEAGDARERARFVLQEYRDEWRMARRIREGGTWAPGRELLGFYCERPHTTC